MTCGVSMRVRPLPRPVIGRLGQCRPVIGRELAARGVAPESPPLAPSQLRKTSFSLLSIILLHYSTLKTLQNITKNMTVFLKLFFNTDQVQGWWSKEYLCSFTSLTINYTWEDNSNEPFHCQCDSLSAPQRKKEREPLSKTFLNTFSGKLWTTYFPKEKAWQVGLNTKTLCFTETCSKEPAHLNWLFFWRAHKLCSIRRGNI